MGIMDFFRATQSPDKSAVRAATVGTEYYGFDDPRFKEMMRGGGSITPKKAMQNPTVLRCVSLVSFSIGMLPLHLRDKETKDVARDMSLFRVLHRRPNDWQTAFEFRSYMQQCALGAVGRGKRGDAYARIVRSRGRVIGLFPLHPDRVEVKQRDDLRLEYKLTPMGRGSVVLPQSEVFHLRYGLSEDGISGMSLVNQAANAIELAQQAEMASSGLFRNGMIVGGILKHPETLSEEAFQRLQDSMEARRGVENAHRSMILEEGMDFTSPGSTGEQAQAIEQRKHQIEEIARPFGVPRPLLGVDDTSWGSGIDVLGQFFVRYGLNPWFTAWEQAIERSLLTDSEADQYEAKFNAGALLRGSMKDQADFFAKGLGAGGHQPFLHPDEPRDWLDLPARNDLPQPLGNKNGGTNEPAETT